ncbi:Cna B-type domain-containing protein [Alloscardovia criceti]|uniref:Cna B-type domain-containing protein n=1 Tax=Alloscardovia criceti TaxID=356828 RepID=UPI00035FC0FF|nr:Cna B-type domain-containing protein [Alloscardovia criceti]
MGIGKRIISMLVTIFVVFGTAGSAYAADLSSGSTVAVSQSSESGEAPPPESSDSTRDSSEDTSKVTQGKSTDDIAGESTSDTSMSETPTPQTPATETATEVPVPSMQSNNQTAEEPASTPSEETQTPDKAPAQASPAAPQSNSDATEDSTLKVDFRIFNLESDNSINDKSEFWVENTVNATASLQVSGSGADAIIRNPWLKITVPKAHIKDLKLSDSQNAYQTIRITESAVDPDNAYIIYKFTEFTGASSAAYPVPFVVNGARSVDGDTITVKAEILDAQDDSIVGNRNDSNKANVLKTSNNLPVLYETTKTYTIRKVEESFNHASVAATTGKAADSGEPLMHLRYDSNIPEDENNEVFVYRKVDEDTSTTTGDTGVRTNFYYSTVIDPPTVPEGQTAYFLKPKLIVSQFRLPDNVEPAWPELFENETFVDTRNKSIWSYDAENHILTVSEPENLLTPWRNGDWYRWYKDGRDFIVELVVKDATYWNPDTDTTEQMMDKIVDIPIQSTVTMPDNSQYTLPAVTAHLLVQREPFKRHGNFWAYKSYRSSGTTLEDVYAGGGDYTQPLSVYSGHYTIRNGVIYDRLGNDQSKFGLYYNTVLRNTNNGSSSTNPDGGAISKLQSYEDYLDIPEKIQNGEYGNTYYEKFEIVDVDTTNPLLPSLTNEKRQEKVDQTIRQINEAGNVLYAIAEDGTKVEIARNVKYRQVVSIHDTNRTYKGIILEFNDPIVMDNVSINIITGVQLTQDEYERYQVKEYAPHQYRTGYEAKYLSDSDRQYTWNRPTDGAAQATVSRITPQVRGNVPADMSLPYSSTGSFINYRFSVGGYSYEGSWGNLKEFSGYAILLLPPAFVYGNKTVMVGDRNAGTRVEPRIVENFKGTGRTALIYPSFDFQPHLSTLDDANFEATIEATKYAQRGNNQVDMYFVYTNNDEIQPKKDVNLPDISYTDELDLDNDGDVNEVFVHRWSQINYIPSLEMVVTHQVGLDAQTMALATTGDLGYDYIYGVTITNNTIYEVHNSTIIGVLPQKGDKVVAPNQDGEYADRGSTFGVSLSKFLEDEETNAGPLERFTVLYQTESHQGDIDGLRDGAWLTKNQVEDVSQVKAFKLALKDGRTIEPKEEIKIYYTSKLPFDKTLTPANQENADVAVSTLAISTDGTVYAEGNKVETKYTSYDVDGTVYIDRNLDGDCNVSGPTARAAGSAESEETVEGMQVDLVDATSLEPVTDPEGNPITATTDANGSYHFDVYRRGSYRVRFTKLDTQRFALVSGGADALTPNQLAASDTSGNLGYGPVLALNPAHLSAVSNAAIESRMDFTASKKWIGITQDSTTVELLANGTKLEVAADGTITPDLFNAGTVIEGLQNPVTLNADSWSHVFANLPKYDKDGNAVTYTARELGADNVALSDAERITINGKNYTVSYADTAEATTVTNTMDNPKTSVSGEKTWDDANNQDGKRPASITVHLMADGVDTGQSAVASADAEGKWTYSFADLNTFDEAGQPITYSVSEDAVSGYTATYSGMNVTNTYTPEKVTVSGTKTWADANNQDGLRPPSITVHLLADGVDTGQSAVVSADAEGKWTYSFAGLDKYQNGKEIVYTVTEEAVTGYTATYKGLNITNTHMPEQITVSGTKTWEDANNQDGKRPASITVHLLADGVDTGRKAEVRADTEWKYAFANVDKFAAGKAIVYTISEDRIEGYTSTVNGMDVTNTYTPEKLTVSGTKTWEDADNQDGVRPETITLHLWADGVDTGKTTTATADTGWTYSFADLDKFKEGKEITYTITEDAVDAYSTTIQGFNITNTHNPEKRDITVTKLWNDADNQDGARPDKVTVHLWANGENTGKTLDIYAATDGTWTGKFTDLDVYKAGQRVNYTVSEEAISGYTTAIDGFTITNTHEIETIDVPVSKVWVDNDNAKNQRPDTVKIQLMADGSDVEDESLSLDAQGAWKGTFKDLPKYKAGAIKQELNYSIEEIAVPGYSTVVEGTADAAGFTVTNTITGKVSVAVTKKWEGINTDAAPAVTVNLLADGVKVSEAVLDGNAEGGKWGHTFTDLDQFTSEGQEIIYTVEEHGAQDGHLTAEGHEYTAQIVQTEGTNTWTITNTLVNPEVQVPVRKVWDDAGNQDGMRPETIVMRLTASPAGGDTALTAETLDGIPVGPLTLTATGEWKGSFVHLPRFDAKGRSITYTVLEDEVDGYTTEITGDAESGFVVTNSHTPETISIPVTKQWIADADNAASLRPDGITVHLMSDSKQVETQELRITPNEDGVWAGTFKNLPKYAPGEEGREIVYSLSEDPVTGYVTSGIVGDATAGFTVSNTLITGTIKLMKVDEAGKPLQGAQFELRDAEGSIVATATSGEDGFVIFEGVVFGNYTVTEVAAPGGYEKSDWTAEGAIDELGQVLDLGRVVNKQIPHPVVQLARTGAEISMMLSLAGSLLLAGLVARGTGRRRSGGGAHKD